MHRIFKAIAIFTLITLSACSSQRVINDYEGIVVYSIKDSIEYSVSGETTPKSEFTYENPKTKQYCHTEESQTERIKCDWKDLNKVQKIALRSYLMDSFNKIEQHIEPPKYDGKEYNGKVSFCVDKSGLIDEIVLARPSGHMRLDNSIISALVKTKSITLPADPDMIKYQYFCKMHVYYDDRDMAK